jgi:23S rRNA (uridine2552-2'-O)-methyltransferase
MARSKSSHKWLQEHFRDEFVKKAQQEGMRSRAVYKLQEIQEKDKLIKPGINILDLGAAPGGWSQYARKITDADDKIFALDILPIEPLQGVEFIQGDFREDAVLTRLTELIGNRRINLVLSDMAPNITGNKAIDQPGSMYLAELALDMVGQVLERNGNFLVKLFQGQGSDEFLAEVRKCFSKVMIRKPKASRPRSNEVYVLAKGFKQRETI